MKKKQMNKKKETHNNLKDHIEEEKKNPPERKSLNTPTSDCLHTAQPRGGIINATWIWTNGRQNFGLEPTESEPLSMIENGGKGEWKRAREKGRGAMKEGERGMNGEGGNMNAE